MPKKKEEDKKKKITLRLDKELSEKLDIYLKSDNLKRSRLIEALLKNYLNL